MSLCVNGRVYVRFRSIVGHAELCKSMVIRGLSCIMHYGEALNPLLQEKGILRNSKKDRSLNPLPHMLILGSFNSAANTDMMSKIWTNEDTIFLLSRKHCEKRRNCLLRTNPSFPALFSKGVCC